MEKYYDLIVSLIKQHRKYSACEDILEEIVKDVSEHAGVVLQSIDNEEVVKSYLEKIVSTSMITVPKKLGLSVKRQTKIVLPEPQPLLVASDNDKKDTDAENEQVIVDEIEELPISPAAEESLDEVIVEESPDNHSEDEVENLVESYPDEDDINDAETVHNDKSNSGEVDITLVDKMINGVDKISTESSENLPEEDNREENLSVTNEIFDTIEQYDEDLYTEEETVVTLEEEEFVDNLDTDGLHEELESAEETELSESDIPDESLSEELTELNDELYSETDDFSLENTIEEELTSLAEEEVFETLIDDTEATLNPVEISAEDDVNDTELPDYECFDYVPDSDIDVDCDEIMVELRNFDAKHPDKNIIEVCRLKYDKNLSVPEIAVKMNVSEEEILDRLNEIIYLVKD